MSDQSLPGILDRLEHTHFHPEWRLLTWHPHGELNDDVADQAVEVIESEELIGERPFNRYADFSQLTSIRLTIGHAFQIAEHRRDAQQRVKSAFFADTIVGFGIARMYEALMKGGAIEVHAFRQRSEAAEWLQVPAELLDPS